jgi:Big-like domain-containing protein
VAQRVWKTVLGSAQLSGGKAKFTISTLVVGSIKVTTTYSGNSNIAKSSAPVTQTVQPASMRLLDCGSAHLGRGTDERTAGEQSAGGCWVNSPRVQDECEPLKGERGTMSILSS